MPSYHYTARDSKGELVSGSMDAATERALAASLSQLGFHPVSITEQAPTSKSSNLGFGRIDRKEVIIVLREISSLIKAGIPLASCLDGAAKQARSVGLRIALEDISTKVTSGTSMSEAFAAHPRVFSSLAVSMIRVGETAGILDQVLSQLAFLGTQEIETRSRVRGALVYPIVLVTFALLVVNGLLLGVLPRFIDIFQNADIQLPWPTKILLGLSTFMRERWWVILLVIAVLIWVFRSYYKTDSGRWILDSTLLRVPIVGALYSKIQVARLMRTLGSMLRTGVPILEALGIAENTLSNVVYRKAMERTRLAVAEGKGFSETLTATGLFPHLVLQLVSAGERAGQLDTMLEEAAQFYEPEIEVSMRNLTTLLEPVLLLTMGVAVGFIALSVLLPIFQLINVFRN